MYPQKSHTHIVCQDALFTEWPKANAIVGNPPFLGGKKIKSALGEEYANKLHKKFPDVKGQPDFCTFWFRKAADNIDDHGRVGLVGTNSIAQNTSRTASLDYVVEQGGHIHSAVSTQQWSGEANVHVSIVNWSKQACGSPMLDHQYVDFISTSLKFEISVANAIQLESNKGLSFQACELSGKGFIISEQQAQEWINQDIKNIQVLKRMIDGKGLINPFSPLDWVIDFADMEIEEAGEFAEPFEWVRRNVKPERDNNSRKARRERWWRFGEFRPGMRKKNSQLSCYFAIPKVVKHVIFQPVSIEKLPCEANMVISSEDFYILGILTSNVHRIWVKAQSSTLEDRTRYTNTTCFETFPFPQSLSQSLLEQIRGTMQDLHEYRSEIMEKRGWGITKLYNEYFHEPASRLYKLHHQLDTLALKAYGFKTSDNILEKLLTLNLELAKIEKNGESIVGPWAPSIEEDMQNITRLVQRTSKAA